MTSSKTTFLILFLILGCLPKTFGQEVPSKISVCTEGLTLFNVGQIGVRDPLGWLLPDGLTFSSNTVPTDITATEPGTYTVILNYQSGGSVIYGITFDGEDNDGDGALECNTHYTLHPTPTSMLVPNLQSASPDLLIQYTTSQNSKG
ncbi:MAG: hypothetical protein AAFO07_23425 [Bacteroidota bacterium]